MADQRCETCKNWREVKFADFGQGTRIGVCLASLERAGARTGPNGGAECQKYEGVSDAVQET